MDMHEPILTLFDWYITR